MNGNEVFLQHILSTSHDELLLKFWKLQLQKEATVATEGLVKTDKIPEQESLLAE